MNPIKITKTEWMKRGQKLYGTEDTLQWEFRCPICKHIQRPEDFRPYKDKGADPNSALWNCIGRFTGGNRAFGDGTIKGPCDYTAYGLLQFCRYLVTDNEGHEFRVFAFSKDEEESEK